MASVQVPSITALLTLDGASGGRVKVATLDGFVLNAYCYLISSTQSSTPCLILGTDATGHIILGKAVEIGVRGNNYGLLDTTPFLVADNAQLSMPSQLVSAIINLSQSDGGGIASGGNIIPSYVPSGNLLMGNNFNPMHLIPPGEVGSILVSDGNVWYAASGSANGVMSVTATSPLASTGGENPILSLNNSGVAANTYGAKNKVVRFTVDAKGIITSAEELGVTVDSNNVLPPAGTWSFTAGTPVAIIDGDVVACNASDATTFPAVGVWTADDKICMGGLVTGLTGLPADSELFVAVGGGVTGTCPNDPDTVEQKIGSSIGTTAIFVSVRNEIYN
jgi:hypothetical protein